MAIAILILIAILIVGLNVAFGNWFRTVKESQPKVIVIQAEEEFSEPVARKYPVLFLYALYHCIRIMIIFVWTVIVTRPWHKYTDQYVAKYNFHTSIPFLKLQYIVGTLGFAALFFAIYAYMLRTKDKKTITTILKLFIFLDLFDVLSGIAKPSLHSLYIVLSTGFDVLVLWSLLKREPNIFKLFRVKQGSKE